MEKSILIKLAQALGLETANITVVQLNEATAGSNFVEKLGDQTDKCENPTTELHMARLDYEDREQVRAHNEKMALHEREVESDRIKLDADEKKRESEHRQLLAFEKLRLESERQDKNRQAELEIQLARLKSQLDIVSIEGQPFVPQVPVRPIRLERLKDNDDPLVFFAPLEKLFAARSIPENQQAGHLVELLGPKALDALSKMSLEDSKVYTHVRMTILKRFKISTDVVRERFRTATVGKDEAYSDFVVKLTGWASTWLKSVKTTG